MNNLPFFLRNPAWLAAALFLVWGPPDAVADPKASYQAAVAAEEAGDYRTAIAIYQALVRQFPQDPKLRARLAQAQLAAREGSPKATIEGRLRTVIIPAVEFEEADLDSVFTYLTLKTEELTEGKVRPNFIYKGSLEERKRPVITLRLSSIPVTEVIRYVGALSGTTFSYEAHAIVGTPVSRLAAGTAEKTP